MLSSSNPHSRITQPLCSVDGRTTDLEPINTTAPILGSHQVNDASAANQPSNDAGASEPSQLANDAAHLLLRSQASCKAYRARSGLVQGSIGPRNEAASGATHSGVGPEGTATVPTISQMKSLELSTRQLSVPITSVKLPIVIPASNRKKQSFSYVTPLKRHHPFVLPGVLLGALVMFIIASLFVIPLDNSQHPRTIAQTIGDLITTGRFNAINTLQEHDAPLQSLPVGEDSCGGTDIWSTCATYITASGVMGTGQMQRPIRGAVITQVFGHMEYQLWCGCWKPHTGIDLAAPYGSPIMAADSGQVIWTGWDWSGLGWAVKINHGHYIATIYGHLERFIVSVGQNVAQGQVIGYEGSTGASTGPHLHFMVLYQNVWVDPMNYVQLP